MARKRKIPASALSLGAIVAVLIVGIVYILVSVLRVEPFRLPHHHRRDVGVGRHRGQFACAGGG